MAAESPPTATSIKGSATPSFISTFLPTRWHSLSERRNHDPIATPAPSNAPFLESPDENRPLCFCPHGGSQFVEVDFPIDNTSTDAWGHTAHRSAIWPAQSTMVTE